MFENMPGGCVGSAVAGVVLCCVIYVSLCEHAQVYDIVHIVVHAFRGLVRAHNPFPGWHTQVRDVTGIRVLSCIPL